MKTFSYSQDLNYGKFYTPNDENYGLLRQVIVVLLGYKVIEHREMVFPQFFYSTLMVDIDAAEVITHKLQLLGWERV